MEVPLTHLDTWETFLVEHKSNFLENEIVSAESISLQVTSSLLENELYQLTEADRESPGKQRRLDER